MGTKLELWYNLGKYIIGGYYMAKDCSFDIVSEYNKQELVNAVDQVKRELTTRFDLKDSNSQVELDADKSITITTNDDMKLVLREAALFLQNQTVVSEKELLQVDSHE